MTISFTKTDGNIFKRFRGRRGRDRMIVGFTTYLCNQSLSPLTLSLNSAHGDVYSTQHYLIKFVSDLRQVGGFLRFPPPLKLTATI
jgi:hypothetical protein